MSTNRNNTRNNSKVSSNEKFDTRTSGKKQNRSNGRKRTKSTKSYDKAKSTREQFAEADVTTNDPAWYSTDAALLRDAASIPYSWAVGTPINLHNPLFETFSNKGQFTVPGICAIGTIPSVGWSNQPNDPVNIAANATYSFVRHANSGHANYDAPDLMLYISAMTQVYSYINWMQRLYGCVTLYSQQNRYLPDALISAQRVDPDDLRNNLANFRYGLNVLINKAATFYVPATMPIYNRQAFIYSNIYSEGLTMKDQLYMYSPAAFWIYQLNTDGAGMLKMTATPSGATVQQLLDYGNSMLNPLLYSEDMNIMSGDILKAYQGNVIKLQSMPSEVGILPLYDTLVLEQMKNATIVGGTYGFAFSSFNVEQNDIHSYLVHEPSLTWVYPNDTKWYDRAQYLSLRTLTEDRLLTTQVAEPGPDVTMEISRMLVAGRNYTNSNGAGYVELHSSSEIAVSCVITSYHVEANGSLTLKEQGFTYSEAVPVRTDAPNAIVTFLQKLANLRSFKFAPAMHYAICKQGDTELAASFADGLYYQDVDNYAVLSNDDIAKLNETALLSLFHVPSITKL